jgi:hypothetical protein
VGDARLEVGGECGGQMGCNDIPAGVGALATLLQSLTEQELQEPPCNTVFPD